MKPLLCAFLWLLPFGSLCEPVWAEPFNPETFVPVCWEQAPGSKYWHPCVVQVFIDKGYIEQRHLAWMDAAQDAAMNNSCLATMDAAMRAMEPFLLPPGSTVTMTKDGYSVETWYRKHPLKKLFEAHEQWDRAKRACWKGQP